MSKSLCVFRIFHLNMCKISMLSYKDLFVKKGPSFSVFFNVFNRKLFSMSDSLYARYNLLDWARLVDECDDKNLVENEEGRLKLLVEELRSNYGVLV